MSFKLAYANVRKSVRDYTIYFLTLTFGVCLFYVFNSMESQQAVLNLSKQQNSVLELTTNMIGGISIFISCILAFLILYANQFLIRRRKKELGIYMTLGMDRWHISKILVTETLVIGAVSLIAGLIIGIAAAQGMVILTAKMFVVQMEEFQFVFSEIALFKTIVYFVIIFGVVILFNTISITRYKLIDLLTASKKNEKLKVKSLGISAVLFVVSIICLAAAYSLILKTGLLSISPEFFAAIGLGIVGTFLFFLSLSGFLLRIIKGHKGVYFKGLNMFVLRQVNAKITTTFVSMTIVCLMLLVTIGVLSSGAGMSNTLSTTLAGTTPFDLTITHYNEEGKIGAADIDNEYLVTQMKNDGVWDETLTKDYMLLPVYNMEGLTYDQLLTYYEGEIMTEESMQNIRNAPISLVTLSDYNKSMRLIGREELALAANEVALSCNYPTLFDAYEKKVKDSSSKVNLGSQSYSISEKMIKKSYFTAMSTMDSGTLIIPDEALQNAVVEVVFVNIQVSGDTEKNGLILDEKYSAYKDQTNLFNYCNSRTSAYEQAAGMTVMLSYLAVYIGIIFLITCSAVLAIQQLSESSDNQERYLLLRKIGTEERDINSAIFKQVAISFLVPLSLAVVHSFVGLKVANQIINIVGQVDASVGIATAAIGIVVVYGGYMMATYFGCKTMAKKKAGI